MPLKTSLELTNEVIKKKHFNFKDRTGEKFITNEGYEVEILEYFGVYNSTIIFKDSSKTILKNIYFGNLVSGTIRNPNHKSVYRVGYLGEGRYKRTVDGNLVKSYTVWNSMLGRCYCKSYIKKQPTYEECGVVEEWHNYQNFAKWFEDNYNSEIMGGWELDKDILCPDCKIYSPETCCFVPKEINYLFTKRQRNRGILPIGVSILRKEIRASMTKHGKSHFIGSFKTPEEAFQAYKTAKENHIKEVADKWKGLISDRVYEAMYNYQVEITD